MIEGGCFCKRIRYAIDDGEYLTANCHCTMCRRVHAAPYVTWLVVPVESSATRALGTAATRIVGRRHALFLRRDAARISRA